ncbi:metalloregulator ArsR/SmtB family transcription factor [Falsarthrobacter nasiphocae]|uniref:DNA-binding transcriptional ArsR family regulator n=1 Tax=Falsarthrobacter nasiphocae TaxID=189863 RepID=A0AAE3YHL6_9MICC|nr:metalloregulator ArsR/SmtB family transcription factor [Falsarthrobacter nasiphocae]MDR6892370.1 DNA-binding transcriptional ArsR family regulator [Falsarthrobacter nasiphocae]
MTVETGGDERLERLLTSLGEPTRRRIVRALGPEQLSVTEIVERLGISQPAASKHLRVLREAGAIEMRPDAQRRLYRVDPAAFRALSAWALETAGLVSHDDDAAAAPDPAPAEPQAPAADEPPAAAPAASELAAEPRPQAARAADAQASTQPPAGPSRVERPAVGTGPRRATASSRVQQPRPAAEGEAPATAPGASTAPSPRPELAETEAAQARQAQKDAEGTASFLQNLAGLPRLSRLTRRRNGR